MKQLSAVAAYQFLEYNHHHSFHTFTETIVTGVTFTLVAIGRY